MLASMVRSCDYGALLRYGIDIQKGTVLSRTRQLRPGLLAAVVIVVTVAGSW